MAETPCTACGRVVDTDVDVHYKRLEPGRAATTLLYFCSARCVAENAGLFED